MIPTPDLIREITEMLASDAAWDMGRLSELADAYAQACDKAMERVYNCRYLLQEKLRREARQVAEEEPRLLAELELLEIDSNNAWSSLCQELELPFPSGFDPGLAKSIIEEADHVPGDVERLVRMHRRMSLGHAPLADHLRVLRQLRQEDHVHDFWKDDVQAFEKARLDELAREAGRADRKGDFKALEAILAGLRSEEWAVNPSAYAASVEKLVSPHRRRFANERYAKLLKRLRDAHSRMNEEECRELLADWYGVELRTGISPSADAAEAIQPVELWLKELDEASAEEKAFQDACAQLEAEADEGENLNALDKLVSAVLRFERGIPEILAARVGSRREELQRLSKRRFALRLVGIIAAAVILAAAAGLYITRHAKTQEIARWQVRIAAALNKTDLEAASDLLETVASQNREVYASPEIQELQSAYNQKTEAEGMRKKRFQQALASLVASGTTLPDTAALQRAARLARTVEEKEQVLDWQEEFQRRSDEQKRRRLAEIDELVAQLEQRLEVVRTAYRNQKPGTASLAAECSEVVRQLAEDQDLSPVQRARLTAMEQSARRIRKDALAKEIERNAAQRDLTHIREAYDAPADLEKSLQAFAENHAAHPLAGEFVKAASMASVWSALAAWRKIRADWDSARVQDKRSAQIRLKLVDNYLESHPSNPYWEMMTRYGGYLSVSQGAFSDTGLKHISSLEKLITSRLVSSVLVIKTQRGCYYTLSDKLTETAFGGEVVGYSAYCIIDSEMTQQSVSIPVEDSPSKPEPAPQTKFADSATAAIMDFNGRGWETFHLRIAELARSNADIDPILRVYLLNEILEYTLDTTPFRPEEMKAALRTLSKCYVPADWMNPEDTDAKTLRKRAGGALGAMSSFAGTIKAVEQQLEAIEKALVAYRPIAVVLDPSEIEIPDKVKDAKLYVVTYDDAKAPVLKLIGEVQDGVLQMKQKLTGLCGNPVYIKEH